MNLAKTIGHEKQKKLFLDAAQNGRLAHAYAFVGEENIGKTTFALDLAKAVGADSVLDIFLFDSEEGLQIEEARNLQARLSLTPVGVYKVAIISCAERMTTPAANSLLKTLEDPPAHSLLILVTSNFSGLLPTISSRLQRVNFAKASEAETKEALKDLALSKEAMAKILDFSSGKIGLAKSLAAVPGLLEFYEISQKQYDVLEAGKLLERLKTAQELAEWEIPKIERFLKIAMRLWVEKAEAKNLAKKLLVAWQDLQYNLNTKLVLDNLFLP